MRTTLTLDTDVAVKAKRIAARLHKPLKCVINEALRVGLEQLKSPISSKAFKTLPRPMGLRSGLNYDNIAELLTQAEGEDHR